MAKVAIVEPMAKRTPSELRGEQLKRQRCGMPANTQFPDLAKRDKKAESLKGPKYIDTRVDEVFPARKFSDRWRTPGERQKDPIPGTKKKDTQLMCSREFGDSKVLKSSDGAKMSSTIEVIDHNTSQNHERGNGSTFLTVKQLSVGDERVECLSKLDMDKALKGLNARDVVDNSAFLKTFNGKPGVSPSVNTRKFKSEFSLPGCKSPLDFTLKTSLRMVSSSSVKWCHKLSGSWSYNDAIKIQDESDAFYCRSLNTWIYPQSSLPSSVISAMSLSLSQAESGFVNKRQLDWDDSFRSLYYMLRKNLCNIFYVHTLQFVAMFVSSQFSGKKHSVKAYIARSTTGFRSLLKEHDVAFTMPLCHSEAVQAAEDDLVELSEIENQNLGRALHLDVTSEVDGSPQSLLAFIGNRNVHALYDFLLNHRHYSASPAVVDVPMLYSPVPFQNSSVSIPEVKCREMKRAEADQVNPVSYSIEIKDSILPPWTIAGLCAAMSSRENTFHFSYTTEPASIGLNVAVDSILGMSTLPSVAEELKVNAFPGGSLGFPEAVVAPELRSGFLTELKYGDGSYEVHLGPL